LKDKTTRETISICVAAVLVVALITIPFEIQSNAHPVDTRGVLYLVLIGVAAFGMALGYRYLTARKRAQLELAAGEHYRRLAEEYRRLADMAVTTQEHTDLKLGELRAELESLQKTLGNPTG
jgi:hypothetical protein